MRDASHNAAVKSVRTIAYATLEQAFPVVSSCTRPDCGDLERPFSGSSVGGLIVRIGPVAGCRVPVNRDSLPMAALEPGADGGERPLRGTPKLEIPLVTNVQALSVDFSE